MTAVYNLHQLELYHGAISSSNVLLTTWNHAFLADFSWFAPNYIYEDLLGDIHYYYPSATWKCNLAPEKFISRDSKETSSLQWSNEDIIQMSAETIANLQKMDIFSLGCVIAELMLDGSSLFSYKELLDYRRGNYCPKEKLNKIKDPKVREMIDDMIQKDPNSRSNIKKLLKEWATEVAPPSFSKLLYYINLSLLSHNFVLPDQRLALFKVLLEPIYKILVGERLKPHLESLPIVIQQEQILQNFLNSHKTIKPDFSALLKSQPLNLFEQEPLQNEALNGRQNIDAKDLRTMMTNLTLEDVKIIRVESVVKDDKERKQELLLIALMICSNIRNVRYLSSLLVGL